MSPSSHSEESLTGNLPAADLNRFDGKDFTLSGTKTFKICLPAFMFVPGPVGLVSFFLD